MRANIVSFTAACGLALLGFTNSAGAAPVAHNAEIRIKPIEGGVVGAQTNWMSQQAHGAPFTIARTYESQFGGHHLLLLSGITGQFRILNLSPAGTITGTLQDGEVGNRGWRSAEIVSEGNFKRLYLFEHRDGLIHQYQISAVGTIISGPSAIVAEPDLVNKSIHDAFETTAGVRSFGLDTATGQIAMGQLPPNISITAPESLGWSDVDHLFVNGETYRVLYKGVGHPFKPAAENGPEAGRLAVQRINASGVAYQTAYDAQFGVGYTTVRLFPYDDDNTGIFFYARGSSHWQSVRLVTGTSVTLEDYRSGGAISDQDDIQFYRVNGTTFMINLRFDTFVPSNEKLGGDAAARFASCVDSNLKDRAAGYQLALLQTGEVLVDRAEGVQRITPNVVPMSRSSRIELGSGSKMFATVTALKLADNGQIDLDDTINDALQDPSLTGWTTERTVRELLAHATGNTKSSPQCVAGSVPLTTDCMAFFMTNPPDYDDCSAPNPPQLTCDRTYVNAHTGALRKVIEAQTGASSAQDIVTQTRALWLDDVVANGPSCQAESDSKLFGRCKPGQQTCVAYGGVDWVQGVSDGDILGWSSSCGAGGWDASARDMSRILEALRGEQVLSTDTTATLFDKNLMDGSSKATAIGWEPPRWTVGANALGKNGATKNDNGSGARSELSTYDGQAFAALTINTRRGSPNPTRVLDNAYRYATDPAAYPCVSDISFVESPTYDIGDGTRQTIVHLTDDYVISAHQTPTHWVGLGLAFSERLRLKSWWRAPDGTLSSLDTFYGPRSNDIVDLVRLSSSRFVAGIRNAAGNLDLHLFKVLSSGAIKHVTSSENADGVEDVRLVALNQPGAAFASVIRKGNGRVQVAVWDTVGFFHPTLVRRGVYNSLGTALEVDGAAGGEPGQIVTVVGTSSGKVKPIVFQVSNNGNTVRRKGSASSADQVPGSEIRLTGVDVDGTRKFVAAYKNGDGELETSLWTVNAFGTSVSNVWMGEFGAITGLGGNFLSDLGPNVAIPILVSDGDGGMNARLRIYGVSSELNERLDTEVRAGALGFSIAPRTLASGKRMVTMFSGFEQEFTESELLGVGP